MNAFVTGWMRFWVFLGRLFSWQNIQNCRKFKTNSNLKIKILDFLTELSPRGGTSNVRWIVRLKIWSDCFEQFIEHLLVGNLRSFGNDNSIHFFKIDSGRLISFCRLFLLSRGILMCSLDIYVFSIFICCSEFYLPVTKRTLVLVVFVISSYYHYLTKLFIVHVDY